MKKLTLMILSLGLFASCSKEANDSVAPAATEQNQTMANGRTSKIFKASFYSEVDVNPAIPPTQCSGDLPTLANPGYFLHGTSTHLGEIISTQSRGQDVSCNLSFATMLLTTSVSGQLAASNGDLIYYTGNDVIDASHYLTGTGTDGTITGTWTITGGTGKFAGASGSFNLNGPADFATGTFKFEAEGTINY
jgi:hypothetical protein